MSSDLAAALATAEGVEETLAAALATRPETVIGVHDALKELTDDLKGPFVTVLSLEIPQEGAGDSD